MASRFDFHGVLVDALGSSNVYFQPPENIKLTYPCIVYSLSGIDTRYADDWEYLAPRKYTVTLIDKNPDSEIMTELLRIKYCSFDRAFASDGLSHFVFTIFY